MIEVDLEDFEEFYRERINTKYFKIKSGFQQTEKLLFNSQICQFG